MKKLYFLDEQEKQRILNLHTEATKKQYLGVNELLDEARLPKVQLGLLSKALNKPSNFDNFLSQSSKKRKLGLSSGLTRKNRLLGVIEDVFVSKLQGKNIDDYIKTENGIKYINNGTREFELDDVLNKLNFSETKGGLSNNFSKKEIHKLIDDYFPDELVANSKPIINKDLDKQIKAVSKEIKKFEDDLSKGKVQKKGRKQVNTPEYDIYLQNQKTLANLQNQKLTPKNITGLRQALKKEIDDEFFPRGSSSQPSTSPSSGGGGGGSGLRFRWWPRISFNSLSPKTQRLINNSLGVAIYGGAAATTSKGIFNLSFKAASNRKRELLSKTLDKNIIQSCKSVGKPTMDEDQIKYYTEEIYEAGQTMFGKFEKVFKRSIETLKTKENFCAMIGLFKDLYRTEYSSSPYTTIFVRFMDKEFSPYWLTRSDTRDYEYYVIKPIESILNVSPSIGGGSIPSSGDGAPKSDSGKIEYIVPQQFKECLKNGKCTNVQEGTNKCLTTKLNNKFYFYSPNPQDQVFIEGHPAAFWSDKSYTTNSDRTEVVNNSKYFYCDGSRLVETTTPICCLDPKAKDNPDCHC